MQITYQVPPHGRATRTAQIDNKSNKKIHIGDTMRRTWQYKII